MEIYELQIGKEYKLTYPKKEGIICTVIEMYQNGDCEVVYKNGKKAIWNWQWLDKIS